METIDFFFKNRLVINERDVRRIMPWNVDFTLKHGYEYESKEINPLSLNITNSLDLIEKLKPLLYFTASHLEKFKNVNNNPPYDTLEIIASFTTPVNFEDLFKIKIKLTHENIFHKINLCIKNTIKKKILILLLLPNPLNYMLLLKFFGLMLKLEDYNGFMLKKEDTN